MLAIKKAMFAALVPLALGIGSSTAEAAQVSIGITIGRPPAPRVVRVVPRRPAVDYVWVEGYWYPDHKHYKWHDGYWTRPPYVGAVWVAPRYERQAYFSGYWQTARVRYDRDYNRDRRDDRDDDRDRRDNRDNGRYDNRYPDRGGRGRR